jgi:hypothetical protein
MSAVNSYLATLSKELKVSRRMKARILAEAEDHLRERAEMEEARGLDPDAAAASAAEMFGTPGEFAGQFVLERATRRARLLLWLSLASVLLVIAATGSPAALTVWVIAAARMLRFRKLAAIPYNELRTGAMLILMALVFSLAIAIAKGLFTDLGDWQAWVYYSGVAVTALLLAPAVRLTALVWRSRRLAFEYNDEPIQLV